MSNDTYHVVVVGGSWAGLAAAIQLGRARRRVLVVDSGRPRNRFALASHGFLGQDGRSPSEILETFRTQVLAYPTVEFRLGDVVGARASSDDAFDVMLDGGASARAERLILATGVVDELPDVPGLTERWGVTVLHCPYCHGYEVADRRLGVLATNEHSLHFAQLLPDWSSDVTLFTNEVLFLDAGQRAALESRGVKIEPRRVAGLVGETPGLTGIRLANGDVTPLDALFAGSRTRPGSPLAERLGCALDDGPQGTVINTDERKETTVPGVYAAGDAARARHSATWAVADGVMAGISAHQSIAIPGPLTRRAPAVQTTGT